MLIKNFAFYTIKIYQLFFINKLLHFLGRSETEDFSSTIYKYDLTMKSGWEIVSPLGGLMEKSIAMRAHSAVYHADTQSYVVFGGFRPSTAR